MASLQASTSEIPAPLAAYRRVFRLAPVWLTGLLVLLPVAPLPAENNAPALAAPAPPVPATPPAAADAGATAEDNSQGRLELAEQLYAQGKFERALTILRELEARELPDFTRAWVDYRLADAPLQHELARPRATTAQMLEPLREALGAAYLTGEDLQPREMELNAQIRESLGDSYWILPAEPPVPGALQRDASLAWPQYQAALDYWAGSTNLATARTRYLAIISKLLRPLRNGESSQELLETLPPKYLERALTLAELPVDRGVIKLALALRQFPSLTPETHGEVQGLLGEALDLARSTPIFDVALWQNAQFQERFGKVSSAERVQRGAGLFQPDLPAAAELYRRLIQEVKAADSTLPAAATQRLAELSQPDLELRALAQFLPGSVPAYLLATRNLPAVELSLYRLDLLADINFAQVQARAPTEAESAPRLAPELAFLAGVQPKWSQEVRSWSETGLDLGDFSLTQRHIRLGDAPEPGAYLIEARAKGLSARTLLLISSLRVSLLKVGGEALVWAVHTTTGQPAANAEIRLWARGEQGWKRLSGRSGSDGIARFSQEEIAGATSLLALASTGESGQAFCNWEAPPAGQAVPPTAPRATAVRLPNGSDGKIRWMVLAPFLAAEAPRLEGLPLPLPPFPWELRSGETRLAGGQLEFDEFGIARGEAPRPAGDPTRPLTGLSLALPPALTPPGESALPLPALDPAGPGSPRPSPTGQGISLRVLGREGDEAASRPLPQDAAGRHAIQCLATDAAALPLAQQRIRASVRDLTGKLLWEQDFITGPDGIATLQIPASAGQSLGVGVAQLRLEAMPEATSETLAAPLSEPVVSAIVELLLAFGNGQPLLDVALPRTIFTPGEAVTFSVHARDAAGHPVGFNSTVQLVRLTRQEVWIDPLGQRVSGDALAKARAAVPIFPPPPASGVEAAWKLEASSLELTQVQSVPLLIPAETGVASLTLDPPPVGFYALQVLPGEGADPALAPMQEYLAVAAGPAPELGWFPHPRQPELFLSRGAEGGPEQLRGLVLGAAPGEPFLITSQDGSIREALTAAPGQDHAWFELPIRDKTQLKLRAHSISGFTSQGDTLRLDEAASLPQTPLRLSLTGGATRPDAVAMLRVVSGAPANSAPGRLLVWLENTDRISLAAARQRVEPVRGYQPFYKEGAPGGVPAPKNSPALPASPLNLVFGTAAGPPWIRAQGHWQPWGEETWPAAVMENGQPHREIIYPGEVLFPTPHARAAIQREAVTLRPLERLFRQTHWTPSGQPSRPDGALPALSPGARLLAEAVLFSPTPATPTAANGPGSAPGMDIPFRWPARAGSWRLAALLLERDGRWHYGELERRVQEPLDISLAAPEFLRAGDRVELDVALENYEERAQELSFTLSTTAGELRPMTAAGTAAHPPQDAAGPVSVRLAPGERLVQTWELRAPAPIPTSTSTPTGLDLLLKVSGPQLDPAMTRQARVSLLPGAEFTAIDTAPTLSLKLPAAPGDMELSTRLQYRRLGPGPVEFSASLGVEGATLALARDLLHSAPENPRTVEEMISATLPAMLLARGQGLSGLDSRSLEQHLSSRTDFPAHPPVLPGLAPLYAPGSGQPSLLAERSRTLLDTLVASQLPSGGWPWALGDPTPDPFSSAYALWALSIARNAGYNVRADALEAGTKYLELALQAEPLRETRYQNPQQAAWMLNALTAVRLVPGQKPSRAPLPSSMVAAKRLLEVRNSLEPATLALLARSLLRMDRDRDFTLAARETLDILASQARTTPHGGGSAQDVDLPASALALIALASDASLSGSSHAELGPPLAQQLLLQAGATSGARTLPRGLAGIALARWLPVRAAARRGTALPQEAALPPGPVSLDLQLGGKSLGRRTIPWNLRYLAQPRWVYTPPPEMAPYPFPRALFSGTQGDPVFLRATAPSAARVPALPNPGLLDVSWFHNASRPTLFEGRVWQRELVGEGEGAISRGEDVEILAELEIPEGGAAYVTLSVPFPAGLGPRRSNADAPFSLVSALVVEGNSPEALPAGTEAAPPAPFPLGEIPLVTRLEPGRYVFLAAAVPPGRWRLRLPLRARFAGTFASPAARFTQEYAWPEPSVTEPRTFSIQP